MKIGPFFLLLIVFSFLLYPSCNSRNQNVPVPVLKAGPVDNFVVDGNGSEWLAIPWIPLYADPFGESPAAEDLQARIKLSVGVDWIGILAEITDDSMQMDTVNPWNGDAIEVFLSDYRGSENTLQISFALPRNSSEDVFTLVQNRFKDNCTEKSEPEINTSAVCIADGKQRTLEIRISADYLSGFSSPAIQVYVDDSDRKADPQRNQLVLFPVGHSYVNSFAMFTLERIQGIPEKVQGSSRMLIRDNRDLEVSVFGLEPDTEVKIVNPEKGVLLREMSAGESFKKTLSLPNLPIDPSRDTLFVYADNIPLGFHELLIAPRVYDSLTPPSFEREISVFKMQDAIALPEPGGTVFIGSSSIRMWTCIYQDFPELNAVHRGFGGSTSKEALMYVDDIVIPYKPSTVIYYEGDNDVPAGLSPEEVVENIRLFVEKVKKANPETRIFLISPKPAIKRMHLWDKYQKVHTAIKEYTDAVEDVFYVDVATPMFNDQGLLKTDIFIEDGIHMNREGYLIWKQVIREALGLPDAIQMES